MIKYKVTFKNRFGKTIVCSVEASGFNSAIDRAATKYQISVKEMTSVLVEEA